MKKLLMIALCLVFTLGTWAQEERASVLEGARDIKSALDNGETLVIETTD